MLATIVVALLAALLGLALCFVGYRFFLVMLPIWGFFAGFWLGAMATALILGQGFLATVTGWVVGFVIALVTAVLSYLFYLVGVAIVSGGIGAAFGSGVMTVIGFDPGLVVTLVILISAIVAAGLTLVLNLQKYVVIILTAVAGANALVLSGLLLFGRVTLQSLQTSANLIRPIIQDSVFWLIVWLVVAVAGIAVQILANRTFTFTRDRYVEGWG